MAVKASKSRASRAASVLELTGIGFLLLLVVNGVAGALTAVAKTAGEGTMNLDIMILMVLWLGRFSVFAYLGARSVGRAGAWWPAAPAGVLALLAAVLAERAWVVVAYAAASTLEAAGSAPVLMLTGAPWLEVGIGAVVAVAASAIGPRLRGTAAGDRSRLMTVWGGVVVAAMVAVLAVAAVDALRLDGARRQAMERSAVADEGPVAELRRWLEALTEAQAMHRSGGSPRFARSAAPLGLEPPAGIDVRVLSAGPDGWAARAVWSSDPGTGCATWHGRVPRPPTTPGGMPVPRDRIVCDR
jgi:hypothetical protein